MGTHPSRVVITRLKLDKDHKKILNIKPNLAKEERKMANTRKKQLRKCRNKVIVYTTSIKNLK